MKNRIQSLTSTLIVFVIASVAGTAHAGIVPFPPPGAWTGGEPGTDVILTWESESAVLAEIATGYDPAAEPIIKIFPTDGAPGTLILTEVVTNVGPVPWTDWDEIVFGGLCFDPAVCGGGPIGPGGIDPSAYELIPLTARWVSLVSSSEPGSFSTFLTPTDIDGDDVPDIDADWAVFDFYSPLIPGGSFLLEKRIDYDGGLDFVAVAEFPTVPIPAALPLLLSGLAGIGILGWRRKTATAGHSATS